MNLPINSNVGLKMDLFSSLGQANFGPNVAAVAKAIDTANFSQFNSQERQTLSTLTNALAGDGDISSADAKSLLATMDAFAAPQRGGHHHHDHGHHHNNSHNHNNAALGENFDFSKCLKPFLMPIVCCMAEIIGRCCSDMSFKNSVDGLMDNVHSSPWKGAVEGALENVDLGKLNSSERSEIISMLSVASADGCINHPEASVILSKLNEFTHGGCFPPPDVQPSTWSVEQNGSKAEIDLGDHTLTVNEKKSEFILTNKETGESSRVWGDPHFDMDNDGKTDVDFWGTMTMNLENGTKITIDTTPWKGNEDMTVSSRLTITQGDQRMVIDNMDQNEIGDMTIDHHTHGGRELDLVTSDGLDIYQSGDGNEWKVLDGFEMRSVTQDDMNETKGDNANIDVLDVLDLIPSLRDLAGNMASSYLSALFSQDN